MKNKELEERLLTNGSFVQKEIPAYENDDDFYKYSPAVPLDTLGETNDLGKPWRYEEDGYTVTRIAPWSPPGCHPVGCGLKLYVNEEGKLVKVEGDENDPVTQGRLCPRCVALVDYVYNPARILTPLIRDPKDRGKADMWREATWDEALDLVEREYKRITGRYGKESVVAFLGTGREGGTFGPMAQMALATPNACYNQSGYACYAPRMAACGYIAGTPYPEWDYAGALPGRFEDERYTVTECLVLWGKAPLESNPDGMWGHAVIDSMKRGTRLIVIDPRVNWLASRADIHLRLRAGTDTALGLALLNVIINEDLYDHDFVEYWCYGFEQLAERVNDPELGYTPEKAAEVCGVCAEDIYAAARMYAKASPAAIQWGLAVDQKSNGMQNGQVIVDLMAITGNLDVPGGQILAGRKAGLNEAGFGTDEEHMRLFQKVIGLKEYPAYVNMIHTAQADLTLKALETSEPYPLKFGMFMGNNFMACTAMEPKRWHDACLKSLEFCIGFDTFMTPSVEAICDVFFPLSAAGEREGTVFTHYAPCTVTAGFTHKAYSAGDTMADYELCYALGMRLNPDKFKNFASAKELLETLRLGENSHGERFDKVSQVVHSQVPIQYYKYEKGEMRQDEKPGFPTPTGRVELWCTAYNQFGEDPLPYYEEPHFGPVSTPELMEEFPLILTTGQRVFPYFHSEQRQVAILRELHPDPLVEINPNTAKRFGVSDGQWVKMTSPFGECVLKAHITNSVDENTVAAEHAWWFPEQEGDEPNLYGVFRSNINNLIPNFHMGKLGFGAPAKCLICNIEPLSESYDTDMDEINEKFGKLV